MKFLEVVSVDIWLLSSSSQLDFIHRMSVIQSFINQITKLGARHTSVVMYPYTILARTYLRTASTLQGLQTLDPFMIRACTRIRVCVSHIL